MKPSSSVFDGVLARGGVAEQVSGRAWLQALLDFEAALARAQSRAGIISEAEADAIAAVCDADRYDVAEIGAAAAEIGNPAGAVVKALKQATDARCTTLFESSGFVISTWLRRRIELGDTEINPRLDVSTELAAVLRSDPEATTYQFVVSAIPSDAASQLADVRGKLHARTLRELEELELLRQAHEAQARHLVTERLAFADQITELNEVIERLGEEIEWRKGVMEDYEGRLQRIHSSRAYRYSAPMRRLLGAGRRSGE